MTKRAAIYIRVSTARDDMISPELQEETCRAMAAREGWEITGVYQDIDLSGRSVEKRDGLRALRKAFERQEFDIALAHAISRFSRDVQQGAEILGQMPVATVLEGVADVEDDFVPLLHLLLAHKQSREIGKRWREVHAHRLSAKLPPTGGPRFGYVGGRKGGPEGYTPDPTTAPVLAEMYRRYARGEGWQLLVADLNARGIPTLTGGVWSSTGLRRVLDSGFGAGFIQVDDKHQEGAHEAVITRDEWSAYTAARARRTQVSNRAQSTGWHLARLVVCGTCGTPMFVSGHADRKYATCARRVNTRTCDGVSYKKANLDAQVAMWLGGHVSEWATALPDDSVARQDVEARLEAAGRALEELEAAQGRLAEAWALGDLDRDAYQRARAGLSEKQVAAKAGRDALLLERDRLAPLHADVYERLTAGPEMSTGEWNDILRRVIDRIEVHDDGLLVVPLRGDASKLPKPGRAVWGSSRTRA